MGRIYVASFEKVAVTAAQDLFQVLAPATALVKLHWLTISVGGVAADAGDDQAEQLSVLIHRGSTNGSGGSTPTPSPINFGDAASAVVVEANNDTPGTEGTFLHAEAFHIAAGLNIIWTPECRITVPPSDLLHITLQDSPTDSLEMNGSLYFEECD